MALSSLNLLYNLSPIRNKFMKSNEIDHDFLSKPPSIFVLENLASLRRISPLPIFLAANESFDVSC